LNLDQEAITLEYEEPTNAHWVEGDTEGIATALFYPEVMIPRGLAYPMSPFIATFGNFKDIKHYQSEEAARRHIKDKVWPAVQRVYVHFENGSLELMKKDAAGIVREVPDLPDEENWAGWLMEVTRQYFDFFVTDPSLINDLGMVAAKAVQRSADTFRALAGQYVASGRMIALWKEVKSVRRQFMEHYETFLPVLMVRRYWREDQQDIAHYELSVKNFEDLKSFYIDCVETSFRLLVIGLATVLIEQTGTPTIKTSEGDRDIWWFEQMKNGIKNGQLDKHPVFKPITDALDLGLRNGVGHHSAHYDVSNDEIAYVKPNDARLMQLQLSYTGFVDKAFNAFCAFELATMFFQFLFVAGRGKLA